MSFTPNSPPAYVDGDLTVATEVGKPRLTQPFAGDNGEYVLQQDFMQFLANFTPLALNTAFPTAPYSSYLLTGESPLQNLDAGIVKWTRTYCLVPASRSDPGSTPYRFIGYAGQITLVGSTLISFVGRPRFTRVVKCRVQHDYFLIGTGGLTDDSAITLFLEQGYYTPLGTTTTSGGVTTLTPLYPITNTLQQVTGNMVDNLNDNATWLGTSFSATLTVPTRTQYLALITAGTPLPNQAGTGCRTGEIIAVGSTLSRWQGNILDRQTTYIYAQ